MKRITVITLITLFALTSAAAASGMGPAKGWGQDHPRAQQGVDPERLAKALELTPGEARELADMFAAHREQVDQARQRVRNTRQEMEAYMVGTDFDAAQAGRYNGAVREARSAQEDLRFQFQLRLREKLGPEKYARLTEGVKNRIKTRAGHRQQARSAADGNRRGPGAGSGPDAGNGSKGGYGGMN
jgi:Spy/CpxP family protein refolding chaperone